MANDVDQVSLYSKANWSGASFHHNETTRVGCSLPEPGLLDETVEVVREKLYGFRNAWKGFADAFSKIGVSPTIFGYSSVALHEDDYVKEHREDVLALAKVDAERDQPVQKQDKVFLMNGAALDEDNLLNNAIDDDEDVDHAFSESSRNELVERKSLTRSAG